MHFDRAGKITQIRQYWDQGSLLKQIDVIGSRSRNWPIRDGKEQSRLIASSSAVVAQAGSSPSRPSTAASRGADEVSISSRSRGSTNNAMNDPHASLSLFQNRDVNDDDAYVARPIAPRVQSAKPPPREYSELFVGEGGGSPSPSPQKIPVKSGGGKNHKANRLFAEESDHVPVPASVKTNAKKYNHFEFGDGEETPKVRETSRPPARGKQWDFEDFATPSKPKTKTHPQAERHFGWSDDEVSAISHQMAHSSIWFKFNEESANIRVQPEKSPVLRPIVHKARPDADPHFEFVDDGAPVENKPAIVRGGRGNKGQGLYEDHVMHTTNDKDDGASKGDVKRALNDVTTAIKNENRNKDFAPHWEMKDESPAHLKNDGPKKPIAETRKALNTHWGEYQDSPENRGINIAGNGMGARKGTQAAWSLFEESPIKKENATKPTGIKTTGNGMGGRKDAESFWEF